MYIPRHFRPEELVPPEVFARDGEESLRLFDERVLRAADLLRDRYGPATVNNWHIGGLFTQRGYRTDPNVGAAKSAHRIGKALDLTFAHVEAAKVRADIRDGLLPELAGLVTRIENGVGWLHIDCKECEAEQVSEANVSGIHFFEA